MIVNGNSDKLKEKGGCIRIHPSNFSVQDSWEHVDVHLLKVLVFLLSALVRVLVSLSVEILEVWNQIGWFSNSSDGGSSLGDLSSAVVMVVMHVLVLTLDVELLEV